MSNPILPVGARAYVDGRDLVTIAQVFPEGSTSLMAPHYCVRFDGGDGGQVKPVESTGMSRHSSPAGRASMPRTSLL